MQRLFTKKSIGRSGIRAAIHMSPKKQDNKIEQSWARTNILDSKSRIILKYLRLYCSHPSNQSFQTGESLPITFYLYQHYLIVKCSLLVS